MKETLAIIAFCICGLMSIAIALITITLPFEYIAVKAKIEEFEAVRTTVQTARDNGNDIEAVAFLLSVAEQNRWLANQQFYNGIVLIQLGIPNIIDEMEPIQ